MKNILIEMSEFSEQLINSGTISDVKYKYGTQNMLGITMVPQGSIKNFKSKNKADEKQTNISSEVDMSRAFLSLGATLLDNHVLFEMLIFSFCIGNGKSPERIELQTED